MAISSDALFDRIYNPSLSKTICREDNELHINFFAIIDDYKNRATCASTIPHVANLILEKTTYIDCEYKAMPTLTATLGVGRVVTVNPGSDNIGREQRYLHCYIVMADMDTMFMGIPITNMAYDEKTKIYYTRHPFEVELVNPLSDFSKKPFNEFWCNKRSVADLRNMTGLDKRRIVQNNFYRSIKIAPESYMRSIRERLKILLEISQ